MPRTAFDCAVEVLNLGLECDEALSAWMACLEREGLRYCPEAKELIDGECAEQEPKEEEEIEGYQVEFRRAGFGCPWRVFGFWECVPRSGDSEGPGSEEERSAARACLIDATAAAHAVADSDLTLEVRVVFEPAGEVVEHFGAVAVEPVPRYVAATRAIGVEDGWDFFAELDSLDDLIAGVSAFIADAPGFEGRVVDRCDDEVKFFEANPVSVPEVPSPPVVLVPSAPLAGFLGSFSIRSSFATGGPELGVTTDSGDAVARAQAWFSRTGHDVFIEWTRPDGSNGGVVFRLP